MAKDDSPGDVSGLTASDGSVSIISAKLTKLQGSLRHMFSKLQELFRLIFSKLQELFRLISSKIKGRIAGAWAFLRHKPWLMTALAIVLVLMVAVISVFGYYFHRFNNDVKMNQGYADSWEELSGSAIHLRDDSQGRSSAPEWADGSGASDDSGDENGLDHYERINNDIIRKEPIDKNVENILLIAVDDGDVDGGKLNSDAMIVFSFNKKTKTTRAVSLMRDIWGYYYTVNEENTWSMSLDWDRQNQSLHSFLYEQDQVMP